MMNMRFLKEMSFSAGLLAFVGCASFGNGVHPDSSDWDDVFSRDLSNAECKSPGWAWDAEGYLTPSTPETLFTKRDYGSFVLDCEYRLAPTGNSGIFIYDTQHPTHKVEIQLLDDHHPMYVKEVPYQFTGALYGRCAPTCVNSAPANELNRMTITARGKDVTVALNGKVVVEADLSRWTDPNVNPDGTVIPKWHKGFPALATIPRHGRIALQGVHGGAPVRFRYLKVKELK